MYEYAARLVRVIDGDSIVLDVDQGFRDWKHDERFRLYGIDTPDARDPEGRLRAKEETERLLAEAGTPLVIRTYKDKQDKYGRYLVDILITPDGTTLTQMLLRGGFGVPYFGGKK